MNDATDNCIKEYRACLSSYIALASIYFVLAVSYVIVLSKKNLWNLNNAMAPILLLAIGLAWVLWLRGFRLRIDSQTLEYRDGMYKTCTIPLKDIKSFKSGWVKLKILTRRVEAQRLVITYLSEGKKDSIMINIKPFSGKDNHAVLMMLKQHVKE